MSDSINKECSDKQFAECNVYNFGGLCCCNCMRQVKVLKHPGNNGFGKGNVSSILGYGCQITFNGEMIFKSDKHGICELYIKA